MMIRKKLAVLMLAGVTCLASGCGNVIKDGTEALGEGRYDAAETAFEEATKNENKEVAADGYQGLGMTYYEQKEYDKALEAFQTALDQGAEQTQELYNLTAVCCNEDGRLCEGTRMFPGWNRTCRKQDRR